VTDFMTALRSYLLGQQAITDLCDRRIYVLAMPQAELEAGARKIVVLLASGGTGKSRRTITEAKIDIVCYGESDFDAAEMERPVAEALKNLNRETYEGVLLHNATVASGPFQARDPETFWPAMRRQVILRAEERGIV
jgi:hypothetical protein